MRQIRIDYRRPDRSQQGNQQRQKRANTPRCRQHPGVHMVLAGSNPRWNTIRYLCPMCNAMGRPPVEVAVGVVSGFWPDRGYGFVDSGGPRIFFHVSDWQGQATPYTGMPATCHVEQNAKGLIGRQVQRR